MPVAALDGHGIDSWKHPQAGLGAASRATNRAPYQGEENVAVVSGRPAPSKTGSIIARQAA